MLLGALGVLGNDACSEVSLKITSGWKQSGEHGELTNFSLGKKIESLQILLQFFKFTTRKKAQILLS